MPSRYGVGSGAVLSTNRRSRKVCFMMRFTKAVVDTPSSEANVLSSRLVASSVLMVRSVVDMHTLYVFCMYLSMDGGWIIDVGC